MFARIVLCIGGIVIGLALFILIFGGAILNSYVKGRITRAVEGSYPGYSLQLGELDYSFKGNCLIAQSASLNTALMTFKVGRVSLMGVRWAQLLLGTGSMADILAQGSLDATNLDFQFPHEQYGIRCKRIRALVPSSELIFDWTDFRPLFQDEDFFALDAFRTTRYRVVIPSCRVLGLDYGDLLLGKAYRTRSILLTSPYMDALSNCDKPRPPFVRSPLMVHEVLAAIRLPFELNRISITNGYLRYSERLVANDDPGVLTFEDVNISAKEVTNRSKSKNSIQLHGEGIFMNEGLLKIQMTIPVVSPDLSFHYSGSLSAMDLARLNAFLDIMEHTRIKSGSAQEASFEIDVVNGQARGHVRGIYRNLEIALLNKDTLSERGLGNRVSSFVANVVNIRNSNVPNGSGAMKLGIVEYVRKPEDTFLQFAWFALKSGVMDVIH